MVEVDVRLQDVNLVTTVTQDLDRSEPELLATTPDH